VEVRAKNVQATLSSRPGDGELIAKKRTEARRRPAAEQEQDDLGEQNQPSVLDDECSRAPHTRRPYPCMPFGHMRLITDCTKRS